MKIGVIFYGEEINIPENHEICVIEGYSNVMTKRIHCAKILSASGAPEHRYFGTKP